MKEERKRILEMVKNNQLSIEDAEKLLTELDRLEKEREEKQEELEHQLMTDVDFFSDEKNSDKNQVYGGFEAAKEKVLSFMDTTFKKLKELDLDFYNSVEVTHTIQQNYSDFEKIYIDIPFGNVSLASWNSDDVRLELSARVFRTLDADEGKRKLLDSIVFQIKDNEMVFRAIEKIMRVNTKVYLPKRTYKSAVVKLLNGTITADEIHSRIIDWKSGNGKIDLSRCQGIEADFETGNGKISIQDSEFAELEVKTISGQLNLDGRFQDVDAQAIGGSIFANIRNLEAERVKLGSMTGSIYVRVPKGAAVHGEAKSNVGKVTVELDQQKEMEKKKDVILNLLKFETGADSEEKIRLYAESKTGNVNVQPLLD